MINDKSIIINDEPTILNAFMYCKINYPEDHIFITGVKLNTDVKHHIQSIQNTIRTIQNEFVLRVLIHLCFIFHKRFVIIRFRRDLEGLDREILDVKETAWELMENIRLTGYFNRSNRYFKK